MLFILAVILIAIGGILFMLFFDDKPKTVQHNIDKRAVPFDQNTLSNDEVNIVFDEATEVKHIEIKFGAIDTKEDEISGNLTFSDPISSENEQALTTNSKINPFNF